MSLRIRNIISAQTQSRLLRCLAVQVQGPMGADHGMAGSRRFRDRAVWRFAVIVCACLAAAGVAAVGASSALASEFTWGSPTMIEHEAPYSGYKMTGYSCPDASFCVAVNSGGDVSVSTDPTGGASEWSTSHVDNAEGGLTEATAEFTGISCPSTELCVATDSVGNIWVSKDPGGGEAAWTNSAKPAYSLQGVSCSSTALCVAVGGDGYVYETTEPTAGASAWQESWVDEFRRLETISCVSGLCLAADESGKIFTSTEPTAGLVSWHEAHIDTATYPELHATCVSSTFCVVADSSGNVLTSTNPTGGASAWKSVHVSTAQYAYPFFAVACGSETACIAATDTGEIYASTNPTGSAPAWKLQTVASEGFLNSAACVSTTLCLVGDSGGNIWASANPVAASPSWSSANVDGVDSLAGVSCAPSASLCVAVDARGRILSSADLETGAPGWTGRTVPGVTQLSGVSCPSTSLCVASADNGVVTSSNPTGPASAWTFARVDSLNLVYGVSCPSSSLCVGFDGFGNVFHSVNPTGGASAWSAPELLPEAGPSNGLSSLSCASESLCVAVTYGGIVYTTTDPTGPASAWTKTELGIADQFYAVSCPTTSLCVGNGGSAIVYSTNPAGGVSAWHREELPDFALGREQLEGVSCASVALCAVWSNYGDVYTSTEPAVAATTWTPTAAEPRRYAPSGLSCVNPGICLLVNRRGDVAIGKPLSETELKKKEEEARKKAEEEAVKKKTEESGHTSGGGSSSTSSIGVAPVATAQSEPTPVPILGQRQTASRISGTVSIHLKSTSKFVRISGTSAIPDGSEVEATNGHVLITVATPNGHTQSAEVWGGRFLIHQERTGSGETHFILSLPLTGCPRVVLPRGAAAALAAVAKHSSGPKSRHLWVSESGGSWGTNGRYVSTTVEGTRWLTLDECDRSEVRVAAGRVKVHDLIHNKTKILTAGKTYVAARGPSKRLR